MPATGVIRSRASAICGLALALFVLAAQEPAQASLLDSPSLVLLPVQSFTGIIDSFLVPFGEGFVPTGPIGLALDPAATNVFGLDNVEEAGYIDVTLILTSPLLSFLGETPRIRIVEAGPTSVGYVNPPGSPAAGSLPSDCDCDCDNGFDFFFYSALTGGGTVQDGVFAGAVFENVNAYQGQGLLGSWIVKPNSIVTWTIDDAATVTFPSGAVVEGIGGRGTLVVTPEPSTFALAALGLAGVWIAGRRKSRPTTPAGT